MTTSSINRGKSDLSVGADVLSADGKRLGVVKQSMEDRFLVDVRWAPDYWLGTETIDAAEDDMVQLIITKAAVGSAKLRKEIAGPGLGSAEDYNGPSPANRPPPSI